VHSFRTPLEDLGTLAKNRVRIRATHEEFYRPTHPPLCRRERSTCSSYPQPRSQKPANAMRISRLPIKG
jgi:hypothetical protein